MKADVMLRLIRLPVYPLVVACVLLAASPSPAQSPAQLTLSQADSMPAWAVPVLRLVSATHVEPTTGVVISDTGLVLVPADFATIGDEIIVLDGGTDIIRNGRPAKISHRFRDEGLQVLSVTGLQRTGAGFSAAPLQDGDEIRLSAFPPAELIAEGAAPLDMTATVSILGENARIAITGQAAFPNVTGPLLDDCGDLAGYSMANGVQSMSTTEGPDYLWKETLKRLLAEIPLEPRITDCRQMAGVPVESETGPETLAEPETAAPETEDTVQDAAAEAVEVAVEDSPLPEQDEESVMVDEEPVEEQVQAPAEESLEELETLPPYEDDSIPTTESVAAQSPPAEDDGMPAWLWLAAAILLIGAGLVLHRIRSRTDILAEDTDQPDKADSTAPDQQEAEPAYNASNLESRLLIHGHMADGSEFEASCRVSKQAINLVIGRSHADLIIDSPAVSRHHASLNGTAESLTISDLGSSNGTSINGVPCLESETMFISESDSIILGNVRCSYEILPDSTSARQEQE